MISPPRRPRPITAIASTAPHDETTPSARRGKEGAARMSVTIRFCGAAHTVTGSCYLLQTATGRLLVDCGLFQGQKTLKELNYGPFPFRPADIDAVLLTH